MLYSTLNPKPLSNTPTVVYKFPFSSIEKEEKPKNKKIDLKNCEEKEEDRLI
jgi:hypothetical protein